MKNSLSKAVLLLLALGLAMPAFARAPIQERERNQMHRIQQGVYSGELTSGEARVLRKEQRQIRKLKRKFLRDGRLTKKERRVLKKRYKMASRHIYQLKHNYRTRYAYRYNPGRNFYGFGPSRFAHGFDPYSPWYNGDYGVLGFSFSQRY